MGELAQGSAFQFERFHLDRRGLFRVGSHENLIPIEIGGRALDLLAVLVEHHGEILSKAEIMAAVWPHTAVEDGNLTLQISALRRILDQGRAGASCIQTVARRGYRFVAPVSRIGGEAIDRHSAIMGGLPTSVPRLSIVVLPFADFSDDPQHGYIADAFTDDLTTDLSRVAGSFVVARSTASTYRGKSVDVRQIGRELGVRYVLEGSVRRSGSRARINVQLIDAETGGHVWAERFETDPRSFAEGEGEIIGRLAHALTLELIEDADRHLRRQRTAEPDIQDLLIHGWAWFYRPRSPASLAQAQAAFVRALELQPHSRTARIGLATALVTIILEGWSQSLPEDQALVEELLVKIFSRSPNHAMAHYALALLRRSQNRLNEAHIEANRAVALDRNSAAALCELGLVHMYLGRPEVGIVFVEKAIRLSPRDPFVAATEYGLGRCHLLLGHLDPALELFEQARAVRPQFWDLQMWLAGALALNGDIDGGRAELAGARALKPQIASLTQWRKYQPWIAAPQYWALQEKTLNIGLRRIGFPEL